MPLHSPEIGPHRSLKSPQLIIQGRHFLSRHSLLSIVGAGFSVFVFLMLMDVCLLHAPIQICAGVCGEIPGTGISLLSRDHRSFHFNRAGQRVQECHQIPLLAVSKTERFHER